MARAEQHLLAIAQRPRPSGSDAAAEVCAYLVDRLGELGFEVEVQESVGVGTSTPTPYGPRYLGAGKVRNVVARLAGTEPGRAVALMSHYDSIAQGPGASDAGVPVAALLEAARGLTELPRMRNDLLVVLTDGEECGSLGAQAFFSEHPWAATVRAVLNFEARGTTGPALMFEAGPGNGGMIAELASCGAPAFASSLFYEVYRRLPNGTDFSISKSRGILGLNFANIDGFVHYHGPLDDIDHADRATLQHHGELALRLARRLGDVDLDELESSDETFFTVGNGHLVRYGMTTTRLLAAVAGLLWLAGIRQGRLGAVDLAKLAAGAAGRMAVSAAAATAVTRATTLRRPEARRGGDSYDSDELFTALACLATSTLASPGRQPAARQAGANALLAVGSAGLIAVLPGAGYITTWPLVGGSVGALLGGRAGSATRWMGNTVAALPGAVVLAPLAKLFFQGLTPRMAGLTMATWQLAGDLAAPAVSMVPRRLRQLLAVGCAAGSIALCARRLLARGADDTRPAPETLSYLLDADHNEGWWLSSDAETNDWTRRALRGQYERGRMPAFFPGWNRDFLYSAAPVIAAKAPEFEVLGHEELRDGRRVRARVSSPRGARQISLAIPRGDVRRWSVDGHEMSRSVAEVGEPGQEWELWLHAVGENSLTIELDLPRNSVDLRILDRRDELLPELREHLLEDGPEPAGRAQAAALDVESWGNATFVSRWVRL